MKLAPKKTSDDVSTTIPTPTEPATTAPTPTPAADAAASTPATGTETSPVAELRFARPSKVRFTAYLAAAAALGALAPTVVRNVQPNAAAMSNTDSAQEVATLTPALDAVSLVSGSMDAAAAHHASYGTYVGFMYPSVRVAASSSTVLLAALVDGTCAFTKIVDGVAYEIGTDLTNETCSDATMQAAQSMLDANSTTAAKQTAVALGASVTAVASAATLWASMSYDASGRPSLNGLTNLQVPGSTVRSVAPDGQTAIIEVVADGTCVLVEVSATIRQSPPTTPCS